MVPCREHHVDKPENSKILRYHNGPAGVFQLNQPTITKSDHSDFYLHLFAFRLATINVLPTEQEAGICYFVQIRVEVLPNFSVPGRGYG